MSSHEPDETAGTEAANIALLRRCYEWANRLMNGARDAVTRHDVEQFFAADASMVTNDVLKCQGIPAHVEHFEEIQRKTRSVIFHPFDIAVAQGERVGVYFKIDVKYTDDREGRIFIAGFFLVRDQRIVDFTEVAHFEGAELRLENH
jgi:hypothetical protein